MRDVADKLLKFPQDKARFVRGLIGLFNDEGSELTALASAGPNERSFKVGFDCRKVYF